MWSEETIRNAAEEFTYSIENDPIYDEGGYYDTDVINGFIAGAYFILNGNFLLNNQQN